MGDISQKGLTRYSGRNLTIIWKSRDRSRTSGACRKGWYDDFYHYRKVSSHDTRVYQRKSMRTSRRDAKLFVKSWNLHGEQANHWVLSLFNGSGHDLWHIRASSKRIVESQRCGGNMLETARSFRKSTHIGCIHVDRFLATVRNGNVYLRASVRMCTRSELLSYASRIRRGKDKPSYRHHRYSTRIMKGVRSWWPTLDRVWKQGRLISKRVLRPRVWKP